MEIFGKSITGRRKSNQDSIYFDYENDAFIMAVADGVGGNSGGDIASNLTTSACKSVFEKFAKNPKTSTLKSAIAEIYQIAHHEIVEMGKQDEKLKGMATTLTIIIGYKDHYISGNIGDSRTYFVKDGNMTLITKDHSYIQEYKDKYPDLPIDPFIKSQLGHVITRSLNAELEKIDVLPLTQEYFTLNSDELFLLCSDGLQPDDLVEILPKIYNESNTIVDFVNEIVEFAYDNGSRDNISVIVGGKKNTFEKNLI